MTLDPAVQPDQGLTTDGVPARRGPSRLRKAHLVQVIAVGRLVLGLALVQAVCTLILAWPGPGSTLHDLPVAVAGPAGVSELAARSLEANPRGAMTVTRLPDLAAAQRAVLHRDVYGALVIEQDGLRLLIASGGSPTVADRLVHAVEQIQVRAQGTYLQIEDLAPNPRSDPRGLAPGSALLAVLATSLGGGIVVFRYLHRSRDRVVALLGFAACAGLASALMVHVVLKALTGSLLLEAGVLALVVLATAAAATSFGILADLPGTGLAVALLLVVGYPISGATSAPELVPVPWDQLGGYLPGGAGITVLRGVTFFGGAGVRSAVLVLATWAAIGLLIVALPGARWAVRLARALSRRSAAPQRPST